MYFKDNITRLAVIAFEKQGSFSISRCGELKKVFLNAYYKNGSTDINPPNEQIYFYNNVHAECDENLVNLLKILKFCSDEEARKRVKEWEESWLENLDEIPFYLEHYGCFKRREGKIDFYSSGPTYYDYLPIVKSNYDGKFNVQLPGTKPKKGVVIEEIKPQRKKSYLVPSLWATLIVFFGIALFFWKGPLLQILNGADRFEKKLVNVAPPSYRDTESVKYYSDTNDSSVEIENSGSDAKDSVLDNLSDAEEEQVDKEGLAGNSSISAKQCTLIVGAFANQGNVDRMKQRLSGMNMTPVVLERNTLTLVGARLDCSDSEEKITEIRSEIEPNAWMFKN